MANEYLDALNGGSTGAAPANPYLDTLESQERAGTAALRGTLTGAVGANPDAVAQKRRVAEYLGYPPAAVEALPQLEQQARVRQIEDATAGAPVTRRRFTDADFAKLAHDDAPALAGIETAIASAARYVMGADGRGGLPQDLKIGIYNQGQRGAAGVLRAGAETAAPLLDFLGDSNPLRSFAGAMDSAARYHQGVIDREAPTSDGIVGGGVSSGVRSVGQQAKYLPLLAFGPAGAAAALAGMAAESGGESYQKAREKGVSVPQSLIYGASDAVVEYATEKIPMGRLLGDLAGNATARQMITRQLAAEIPGEQIATLLQDANEWAALNPDKSFQSFRENYANLDARGSAALQTLIATVIGAGGNIAVAKGIEAGMQAAGQRFEAAQQSERGAQHLQQLVELAKASKLAQRAPDTFEQFVSEATQDGPLPNVFIAADALMQSGVAEAVAQASPAVAEQLQTALQTGGDIRIPTGDLLARIAPLEGVQSLVDHLKTEPGGWSRIEAQDRLRGAVEELQQDADRKTQEIRGDDAFRASADTVKAEIRAQLDTAGRFKADANEAYATLTGAFYQVQAARLGITPQELFQRYPLRLTAERVLGEVLHQAASQQPSESGAESLPQGAAASSVPAADSSVSAPAKPVAGQQVASKTGESTTSPAKVVNTPATPRAFYSPSTNTIALLKGADLSSFLHEAGHAFLEMSMDMAARLDGAQREGAGLSEGELQVLADANALLRWFGVADLTEWYAMEFEERRGLHEQFAESFEGYLFSGKAPSIELQPVFQRFRAWLLNVYKSLKAFIEGHPAAGKLSDEVRGVMDRMLASTEQIKLAEQGRSMLPLFATAEQAGMTPEEFAAYQALGVDATNSAIEELQAKGLSDMQWLARARARVLRRLQGEAKERRREVRMEARAEVLQQPVYRAWQFLTAKVQREDMLPVEARRDEFRQAMAEWRKGRAGAEAAARAQAEREAWEASPESQKQRRRAGTEERARRKVLREQASTIDAAAEAALTEWDAAHPEPVNPDQKRASNPNSVDPSVDSLLVAIAKLGGIDRESARTDLGVPADDLKAKVPVFGKSSVFRLEGGKSADTMAEALAEYGYLPQGEYTLHDLEERIGAELRGETQFSAGYDYAARFADEAVREVRNPAALQAGRLDLVDLRGLGLEKAQVDLLQARKMVAKDGLPPDVVAELFGFSSGHELALALAQATPLGEAIEAVTDARMLERYGELATPEALERAADAAIHNETRARMIATEASILARAVSGREQTGTDRKGRPTTQAIVPRAAREFAQQLIARLRVRDVLPGQYAAAEARAARNAEKASKAGDIATAAAEKRNQLVQHYSSKAAHDALDEVDRGLRYLRSFDREGTRKSLDADYLEQIDALLERFDLRKASLKAIDKRKALATWLEAQREAGIEPDIPEQLKNEAFRKSYRDLSVEEFRGLVDSVRQIEHLARLKHKLLTARDQRSYEAIRDEIAASIEAHAGGRRADTRTPTTNTGRRIDAVRNFVAVHFKVAMLARVMDGGQDGGLVWEHFIRTANERGDREATMRAEATQALSDILAPVFKRGRMGGKGQWYPSIGRSLNREARLAIALNTGNEGNLQRLLGGEGWQLEQLLPVLQSLSREEWQAVQAIWDHFEQYRPQIAEKERRVYGKEPAWVEPRPLKILLTDGQEVELRGGYYPIKYDAKASERAEAHADAEEAKRQLQGAYTSATTRRSFTKSRAEEVTGRPLLYTLSGLYSGVNDVIHDLQWHEWLIDANRLLRGLDGPIRERYGAEAVRQFKDWIQANAEGERSAAEAGEGFAGMLRRHLSVAVLGFNLMSAAMQPLGFTQSIVRVGAKWVGKGVGRFIGDMRGSAKLVAEKSEFMRNRSRTRFRELGELRNRVQEQSALGNFMGTWGYMFMMRAQQLVDIPTWLGAYEKALFEGNDDERAVALADQAVIDSQGGGQVKDLAAIERGGKWQKLFTVLYSFLNTAFNLGAAELATQRSKAKLVTNLALLYTVPSVLNTLLRDALTPGGGDEDWGELARRLIAAQLDSLMGLMVGVREFAEVTKTILGANDQGRDYTGPAGLRMVTDAAQAAKQAHQGEFDMALLKSTARVIGDLTGLPSAQFNRTITGAEALIEGETANPAALAFGFQKQ